MKALSVRQPWAWLLTSGAKDVENRTWRPRYRGELLIHAAAGMTAGEYETAKRFAAERGQYIPPAAKLERGGIVGVAYLISVVVVSDSPWFTGPYGLEMICRRPLPFVPCRGWLRIFNVDPSALKRIEGERPCRTAHGSATYPAAR